MYKRQAAGGASPSTIPSTELSPSTVAAAEGSGASGETPSEGGVPQIGGGRGYRAVATPSPSPGVFGAPIMTWGAVAATPVLLDRESPTPGAASDDGGRPFLAAPPSRKEAAARQASAGIHKKRQPGSSSCAPTTLSVPCLAVVALLCGWSFLRANAMEQLVKAVELLLQAVELFATGACSGAA